MKKVTEIVSELAEPVVKKHGCELWDVEYVKEAGGWVLRVYIDREGGVSLEHCEAVSRELDPILDEKDPIPDSYTFEVSSAGAERTLKRPSDFQKFLGHLVEIKLYRAKDGRKEYIGNLVAGGDGNVEIAINGKPYQFAKPEIANVRLRIS
ncbi:MAG: ribosome maturation factor RimP [Clostridiales bacterium]|nr:ribosome maturation factor RimP [Clostridiales bacterium]